MSVSGIGRETESPKCIFAVLGPMGSCLWNLLLKMDRQIGKNTKLHIRKPDELGSCTKYLCEQVITRLHSDSSVYKMGVLDLTGLANSG